MVDLNLNELRKQFADFSQRDFVDETVSVVVEELKLFYNVFSVVAANLGGYLIFRVRICDEGDDHNTPDSVWCKPPHNVNCVGRANDVGQSVFYGSFDPRTAIIETKVKDGDRFSLAAYKLRPLEEWKLSSIVIKNSTLHTGQSPYLDQFGRELSEFMGREFTKEVAVGDEYQYKKSCAVANLLMEHPYKDSILYPSVKNHDMINIALQESHARNRLDLQYVLKCKMVTKEPEIHVVVVGVEKPVADKDKLEEVEGTPSGYRLSLEIRTMRFSDAFDDTRVSSPEDIIQHMLAHPSKG